MSSVISVKIGRVEMALETPLITSAQQNFAMDVGMGVAFLSLIMTRVRRSAFTLTIIMIAITARVGLGMRVILKPNKNVDVARAHLLGLRIALPVWTVLGQLCAMRIESVQEMKSVHQVREGVRRTYTAEVADKSF